MWLHTFTLSPAERVIVLRNNRLATVLNGAQKAKHMVFGKNVTAMIHNVSSLQVDWVGIDEVLRFQRALAEKFWQIIDVPAGQIAVVRHEHLPATVLPGGKSHAFWRPENGQIDVLMMPAQSFRLPEDWEQALLNEADLAAPLRRVVVNPNERMLVEQDGALADILDSGRYVLYVDTRQTKLHFPTTDNRCFTHEKLQLWAQQQPELIGRFLETVEAGENELVLCSANGEICFIMQPQSRHYFWRNNRSPLTQQRVPLGDSKQRLVGSEILGKLRASPWLNATWLEYCQQFKLLCLVDVPENHEAVVRFNHEQTELLPAGVYYFWTANTTVQAACVDKRRQVCEISGQELLSADKITLRVNAVCHYHIADSLTWVNHYTQADDFLYKELQLALRAVIGGKDIDTLLAEKQQIDNDLAQQMAQKKLPGIVIDTLGIKDIILPGEIRTILAQVVQAEKSALANNIRRREETAATRSLLNTARVMEDNPTALRLKELETLEKVTEKIDKISVFGGLDGVLKNLINIRHGE